MQPEASLPHSQVPATCPYPEPDRPSLNPQIALPEDPYTYVYIDMCVCVCVCICGYGPS